MIDILVGDITDLDVDIIVNAANESLMGGGGVDGAIHRVAGSELLAFNRKLGGCPTGQARLSPGFNLPARHIIHTVGPVWHGGTNGEAELLTACYQSVFKIACEIAQGGEIAFPAISTGVYGYPKTEAAPIALQQMLEHEACFKRVIACCFKKADAEAYRQALVRLNS